MPSVKHLAPVLAAAILLVSTAVPAHGVSAGTHSDPRGDVSSIGYVPVHGAVKKRVADSIDLTRAHVTITGGDVVYRIHFAPALRAARSTRATVGLWLGFVKEKPQRELAKTKQMNWVRGRLRTVGPAYITTSWSPARHLAVFRVPTGRLRGYRVDLQSGAVWKRAEYVDTMSFGKE